MTFIDGLVIGVLGATLFWGCIMLAHLKRDMRNIDRILRILNAQSVEEIEAILMEEAR